MFKWALILNGLAHEITDLDPEGRFHESMVWVPCEDYVQVGWTFIDGKFLAPVGPDLDKLKKAAKDQVREMRVAAFATLAGIQSESLANGDTKTAKAICGLQDQLRAITDIDLSACNTQAEIDGAFAEAWQSIVAAAPANVASAFNGVQP